MALSEPTGELWSEVKPRTEWPDTDEDMMGALYFALVDSAEAFAGLSKAELGVLRTTWWDQAGVEVADTLKWEIQEAVDIAGRMLRIGGLAGAFAVDVKNAKSYIRNMIALNHLPYEAAGALPFVGDAAQRRIVDQVVRWVNGKLDELASAIATRQNVDHGKVIEELGNSRNLLEWGKDLLQDNANLIGKVSDVVGDVSTILGLASDAVGTVKNPIAQAASEALGGASLGTGIAALGGHAVSKAAGGDVADETLQWDAEAVTFGAAGTPYGTTRVVAHQALAELASSGDDPNPSTFFNDLGAYWRPRNDWQVAGALVPSTPVQLVVPFSNAVHDGMAADDLGQRARDEARARDRVGAR